MPQLPSVGTTLACRERVWADGPLHLPASLPGACEPAHTDGTPLAAAAGETPFLQIPMLWDPKARGKTRCKNSVKQSQTSGAAAQQGGAGLALVTPGCSCCLSGCAQRQARTQGWAGQPGTQTGWISADTEIQALPFGSFLISVVRGQGFHGNWKADKCDPLREGLRALAAQTSRPLPLVLVTL